MPKKLKILFWIGDLKDPSPRFRFLQFIEPLREKGLIVDTVFTNPSRNRKNKFEKGILNRVEVLLILMMRLFQVIWVALFKAWRYDVVFTNKDILPNTNIYLAEKILSMSNPKLIFDIDDAIYLSNRGPKLNIIWKNYKGIIAGSPVHIEYIQPKFDLKCFYIPMAIDTQKYQPQTSRKEGKIRIGWSGSHHTNVQCLPVMKVCMEMLAEQLDFELIVISNLDPEIKWKNVQSRFIQWTADTEVEGLQQIDIGLMPLEDGPFERGKCALKAVQYMAIGIPALVSPVGVNSLIVKDDFNGFQCKDNQAFVDHILTLANNENKRIEMGKNARKTVEEKYAIEVLTQKYIDVFTEIANTK
jgi:glycosyltransferase involved in cell wall biosynthesis